MESSNMQSYHYQILTGKTLDEIAKSIEAYLNHSWQKASDVKYDENSASYYIEMIQVTVVVDNGLPDDNSFNSRYAALDEYVKDLLEVNDIHLNCIDSIYSTMHGKDIIDGISPTVVLALIKDSKHCPIDLDEEKVLDEISKLV